MATEFDSTLNQLIRNPADVEEIRQLRAQLAEAERQRDAARAKCAEWIDATKNLIDSARRATALIPPYVSVGVEEYAALCELSDNRPTILLLDRLHAAETDRDVLREEIKLTKLLHNKAVDERDVAAGERDAAQRELRQEWAFNHHCGTSAIYGDDGELHCNACRTDFKRMPFEELGKRVFELRARDIQKTWDLVEELRITKERCEALEKVREAAELVRDTHHQSSDVHQIAGHRTEDRSYAMGVADGHRCAANMVRDALAAVTKEQP